MVGGPALRLGWWRGLRHPWYGSPRGRGHLHDMGLLAPLLPHDPSRRQWLRDMLAGKRDLTDIKHNASFFLGRRKNPPRFGRFSYMEKCEYWALIWGAVIMTCTGILLWFDNFFIQRWSLQKGLLDVALVIHYYEAWLATLAIFCVARLRDGVQPGGLPDESGLACRQDAQTDVRPRASGGAATHGTNRDI